ncbi:MAG: cytochrome c [Spirosomaceae bacterium]|jgi:outer membrane murein-binding lipoprotein Lpp|nr:cytochrome c [Spirosomataceae bacterium]
MTSKDFLKAALVAVSATVMVAGCAKKEDPAPVKVTYAKDIKAVLVASCAPCHVAGGTNPNKWDDYTTAKNKIATILDRVQRMPGQTGFMPRNGTAQLPAATIALLKQWQTDGLLEN